MTYPLNINSQHWYLISIGQCEKLASIPSLCPAFDNLKHEKKSTKYKYIWMSILMFVNIFVFVNISTTKFRIKPIKIYNENLKKKWTKFIEEKIVNTKIK